MDDPRFRSQIEVLSVVDKGRRREWTDAEKVRIVEESLRGFRQCAATARRYEISRAVLRRWRRDFRSGQHVAGGRPQFLAVQVASDELTQLQAVVSAAEDMIRHLRLQIAKLRREQYGHSAERHARLIEQLEMRLEDLEADLGEDCAKADAAPAKTSVAAFARHWPARKPFPGHLPRERVVVEAPTS